MFGASFIAAIVALTAMGRVPWPVPVGYVVMSLLTFCVYAFDKSAAMNRRWRTREDTLQFMSLVGGWPGALVGQRLFHHKSKKVSFQVTFWFIVTLHFCAVIALVMRIPRVFFGT